MSEASRDLMLSKILRCEIDDLKVVDGIKSDLDYFATEVTPLNFKNLVCALCERSVEYLYNSFTSVKGDCRKEITQSLRNWYDEHKSRIIEDGISAIVSDSGFEEIYDDLRFINSFEPMEWSYKIEDTEEGPIVKVYIKDFSLYQKFMDKETIIIIEDSFGVTFIDDKENENGKRYSR